MGRVLETSSLTMNSWMVCTCGGCHAFVVPAGSEYRNGLTMAVVTKRSIWWQGLEQDIISRVSAGSSYTVSACVGASGIFQGSVKVFATIKLVYQNSELNLYQLEKNMFQRRVGRCWKVHFPCQQYRMKLYFISRDLHLGLSF